MENKIGRSGIDWKSEAGKIREFLESGWSYRQISTHYGVPYSTVQAAVSRFELCGISTCGGAGDRAIIWEPLIGPMKTAFDAGMTFKQIADSLGIGCQTVRSKILSLGWERPQKQEQSPELDLDPRTSHALRAFHPITWGALFPGDAPPPPNTHQWRANDGY